MRTHLTALLKSISLGIALIALMMLSQGVAKADPVIFSTNGSFNGGANSIVFGGGANTLTINFTGVNSNVDANPSSFASLGEFQTIVSGSGASIVAGTTFTLRITQTIPSAGTGSLFGTLNGTITQNSSTGLVTFSVTSAQIDGVTYTLANNPLPLVPPSTNNGVTTVQARIDSAPIPEPATMLLLGTGLAGVAAKVRKRRKAAQSNTEA